MGPGAFKSSSTLQMSLSALVPGSSHRASRSSNFFSLLENYPGFLVVVRLFSAKLSGQFTVLPFRTASQSSVEDLV